MKKIEGTAAGNRIGVSRDHWLMTYNTLGEWEKVALIFGFADDAALCDELAEIYMDRYRRAKYMCMPAN